MGRSTLHGAIAGLAFLVLLPLFVLVYNAVESSGRARVDDTDLLLERRALAPSRNALGYLVRAYVELNSANPAWDASLDESSSPDLLIDLVERHRNILSLLEQALELGTLQLPAYDPLVRVHAYGEYELGRLLVFRARLRGLEGKPFEATEDAMRILRLGDMLARAQGDLGNYGSADELKRMGLAAVREHAARGLPASTLESVLQRVQAFEPDADVFRESVQLHYSTFSRIFDDPVRFRAEIDRAYVSLQFWGKAGEAPKFLLHSRYVLQSGPTKAALAELFREVLKIWEQPCASASVPAGPPEPTGGFYVIPNAVGKSTVSNVASNYQFGFTSKCHVKTEFAATELMLARLIYRAEHGRFPESLGALVPDYLPGIPLDDFDGLPIRMSSDETMLYSVGEDFDDDGGDADEDVVFPLR